MANHLSNQKYTDLTWKVITAMSTKDVEKIAFPVINEQLRQMNKKQLEEYLELNT